MLKSIIASIIALSTSLSMANCLGEAQIIAKASEVSRASLSTCIVKVDPYTIKQFNENMNCPLDLEEVLASGIEIKSSSTECSINTGDQFSGVLVKEASGKITLE